jgi:putative transcriptional regulator
MHHLKTVRERLGVTQQALADAIGCTQGNVWHYENGQSLPPYMAERLIKFSSARGLRISYDHIYGSTPIPEPATEGEGA